MTRILIALLAALLPFPAALAQEGERVRSERHDFRLTTFARGLEHPWGAALLPDGRLLVTERPGRLRLVGRDGAVSAPLANVPAVEAASQGGLLDVALAPDFTTSREVFLCQAMLVQGGALTRLVRARLGAEARGLEQVTPLLDATPPQASGRQHYGCRIAFGPDGRLYLSTGDRNQDRERAQRLDDLAGKVLRLDREGRAQPDNPFAGRADARAEVFSYGHRHPQGLAFNPWTGSLWEAEFGPRGGDEINILRPGRNYGWPRVTWGVNYSGTPISDRKTAPGMEDPIHVWVPAVSPSGIAFYDSDAFPAWRGSLFVAALNPPGLVRLTTDGDRVVGEERLLFDRRIRLRDVLVAQDGALLLLTDEARGRILRLAPGG
ncbi:PQQ-dependent sugar dehydrogenase [Falsiroseomonas selenitidurans]|uniref:PQQ-dependent sugar dehydrogenase n=1 Tax=Falsiroseomonas selenitidurans TaxID=2716335 RepID=A0ABX1EBL1_9PROT|nr:PQQ-dependent sugar dehydrogenase [Falsiroseomonas selenitidurans]NKC32305.1 PQQ-dependent sugar dehydrogenase [Falsiroseomonas selenitidurans]